MMTIFNVVTVGIAVIAAMIGLYAITRNYAIESLGELRYMLKCAKERRDRIPDDQQELLKIENAEIKSLEERIANHWGRKLAGNHKSMFDIIPTPEEDSSGRFIRSILNGK